MKQIKFLCLALMSAIIFASCSKSAGPAITSSATLKMSAATANGKTTITGRVGAVGSRTDAAATVTLTDVKVNVKELEFDFDHEDEHFKKDSAFNGNEDAKLKGPFIVDLMNAGAFVDQVITTVNIPNAKYEKVGFKVAPSKVAGDMNGKSILITGTIGTIPFVFWHDAKIRFEVKFQDSTALAVSGAGVTLAIHLELDKIMSVVNGGVDLSTATDGNKDGTITIDPLNDDGNKQLADQLIRLLMHRTHCEKKKD